MPASWSRVDSAQWAASSDQAVRKQIPVYIQVLDPGLYRQAMWFAQKNTHSNIRYAPTLTLHNGIRGSIISQVRRPFVTGIDSTSGEVQPLVATFADGFAIQLRAIGDVRTQRVRLDCTILRSSIEAVETAGVRGGNGKPLTVQVPTLNEQRCTVSGDVADGETLLVSPLSVNNGVERLYVMLTPRIAQATLEEFAWK